MESRVDFLLSQDSAAVKASAAFQRNAQIESIRLLESQCSVEQQFPEPPEPLSLSLALAPEVLPLSGSRAGFAIRLSVEGKPAGGLPEQGPVVRISGRFGLTYRLNEGYQPTQAELDAFKDVNAVFNCWPFFREFVQSMTGRMGLHVSPMPLLRLTSKQQPKPLDAQAEHNAAEGSAPSERSRRRTPRTAQPRK